MANQGLTEYIDDAVIRNTSRELSSALNVSPVVLNAAADILVKEELRVRSSSFIYQYAIEYITFVILLFIVSIDWYFIFQRPGPLPPDYGKRKNSAPFTLIMPTRHCYSDILEDDYEKEE